MNGFIYHPHTESPFPFSFSLPLSLYLSLLLPRCLLIVQTCLFKLYMSTFLTMCQRVLKFQFIQSLINYLSTEVTPPPIWSFLVNDHISCLIMKASSLRLIYDSVSLYIPPAKFCHFWIGGTSSCYPTCANIIHAHIYIIFQLANVFNWTFCLLISLLFFVFPIWEPKWNIKI